MNTSDWPEFHRMLTPGGWLTPPADGNVVYVDAQSGSDANPGGSPAAPLRSLAAVPGRRAEGRQNTVFLRCGSRWAEPLPVFGGGRRQPTVYASYGDGPQPEVRVAGRPGAWVGAAVGVVLYDIGFYAEGRTPGADGFRGEWSTVKADPDPGGVEGLGASYVACVGCTVRGFRNGLQNQQASGKPGLRCWVVHRCVVTDCWSEAAYSQGVYLDRVAGVLVSECVFDHNGYRVEAGRNIHNHDIYLTGLNSDATVRGCLFSRSSATGVQQRCGGENQDNLFLWCPMGMTFGWVMGAGRLVKGGARGSIRRCAILGGSGIGRWGKRGIALTIGNVSGLALSDVVAAFDPQDEHYAVEFRKSVCANTEDSPGVHGVRLERVVVHGWHGRDVRVASELWQPSGPGSIGDVVARDCLLRGRENAGAITFEGEYPAGRIGELSGMDEWEDWRPRVERARRMTRRDWDADLVGSRAIARVLSAFGLPSAPPAPPPGGGGGAPPPPPSRPVDGWLVVTDLAGHVVAERPQHGQVVGPGHTVRAEASGRIDKVQFYVNGQPAKTEASAPYYLGGDEAGKPLAFAWPAAGGACEVRAEFLAGDKVVATARCRFEAGDDSDETAVEPDVEAARVHALATKGALVAGDAGEARVRIDRVIEAL